MSQAASYRAIFNLTSFTKIIERFIYNRLTAFMNDKLNDRQDGFRQGRSCQTAVAMFTQEMSDIIDKPKGKGVALFLDFKKAFDSVNRKMLLPKLEMNEMKSFLLPPYLIGVIRSYFTGRKFRVINGNYKSKYFNIDQGCVPCSCLGQICFSLLIAFEETF